jgi:hypothetical protein
MTAAATIPVADVVGAAPLASPNFTGTPTAVTQSTTDNSTALATTAFVVNALLPKTYSIGPSSELGGYVFYVTPDGRHGLVAATQDQCDDCTWYSAEDEINKRSHHDTNGQQFTNWRLPTFYELGLLYGLKDLIGGFSTERYWSSTATGTDNAEYIHFSNGSSIPIRGKANSYYVRAVRSF